MSELVSHVENISFPILFHDIYKSIKTKIQATTRYPRAMFMHKPTWAARTSYEHSRRRGWLITRDASSWMAAQVVNSKLDVR